MKSILTISFIVFIISGYSQDTKEFMEKVRTNASTFHKNFSAGTFEKNGPLVTENIYVNSNNAILNDLK
jgi:hypothetical protein